jgi:hypothetical protein
LSNGQTDLQRIADSEDNVAYLDLIAVGETDGWQGFFGLYLEDGNIGLLVTPDQVRLEFASVWQADQDAVNYVAATIADDMIVGDDQTVLGDDDPGANALGQFALAGPARGLATATIFRQRQAEVTP